MYGQPDDVEGECNAHLYMGDDYGDNTSTVRCQLPKGHLGPHIERFRNGTASITWENDERCWHELAVCDHPIALATELDPAIFGPNTYDCTECNEFLEVEGGIVRTEPVTFCRICGIRSPES